MRWALRWGAVLLLLDLTSFLGHYLPALRPWTFAVVVGSVLALALRSYRSAVLLVCAELFVGSYGYLTALDFNGVSLSLRQAMFLAVLPSALPLLVQRWREPAAWRRDVAASLPLVALAVIAVVAFARGLFVGRDFGAVFFDANAYVFLGLVLPLLVVSRDAAFSADVTRLLLVAAYYLAAKTLLLLYFFTHDAFRFFVVDLYLWLRDSRLGEFTPTTTDAYRIFMSSQLFLLPAWWLQLWRVEQRLRDRRGVFALGLLGAGLLVSFSRSFWLGWFVSLLALVAWLVASGQGRRAVRTVSLAVGSVAASALLVAGVLRFPVPAPSDAARLAISERLELRGAAASSRWNLLPPLWTAVAEHLIVGSGFGREVTYVSNDPRVRAVSATGRYTTTAFEWGYLDTWLKLGFLGLGAYAWIIGAVFSAAWRVDRWRAGSVPLLVGLVAVLGVNVGSPYLNHPLGLGFILLLYARYVFPRDAVLSR